MGEQIRRNGRGRLLRSLHGPVLRQLPDHLRLFVQPKPLISDFCPLIQYSPGIGLPLIPFWHRPHGLPSPKATSLLVVAL